MFLLTWSGSAETRKNIFTVRLKEAELVVYFSVHLSSLFFFLNDLIKLICIGRYYCCNCLHLEFKRTFIFKLTIAQQFLDRCFKRRYISKKLEIGELLCKIIEFVGRFLVSRTTLLELTSLRLRLQDTT